MRSLYSGQQQKICHHKDLVENHCAAPCNHDKIGYSQSGLISCFLASAFFTLGQIFRGWFSLIVQLSPSFVELVVSDTLCRKYMLYLGSGSHLASPPYSFVRRGFDCSVLYSLHLAALCFVRSWHGMDKGLGDLRGTQILECHRRICEMRARDCFFV